VAGTVFREGAMRYALRKRDQRWIICIDHSVALELDDFNEAFEIAWNAALVLRHLSRNRSQP